MDHLIETYPAKHGFLLRDTPTYDPAAAERHWETLLALLERLRYPRALAPTLNTSCTSGTPFSHQS